MRGFPYLAIRSAGHRSEDGRGVLGPRPTALPQGSMKESDTDGLQTSVTTDETPDQNHPSAGDIARRQFLGAAAVAVGVVVSSENTEADASETVEEELHETVEWKASGVWNSHLIPARNALISSEGVDIVSAKEELREALQKLEALEADDEY